MGSGAVDRESTSGLVYRSQLETGIIVGTIN
jgi:hypothetical protein